MVFPSAPGRPYYLPPVSPSVPGRPCCLPQAPHALSPVYHAYGTWLTMAVFEQVEHADNILFYIDDNQIIFTDYTQRDNEVDLLKIHKCRPRSYLLNQFEGAG